MSSQSSTETEDPRAEAIEAAEEIREVVAEKADDLKRVALEKGQQLRDVAVEKVDNLKNYAEENLGISGERLDEIKVETERYVRENPVKSVFIALGLGFVIGRILK